MTDKTLLYMKKINKIYPGVKALNEVDFKVSKGKVHALMGENGAGKSTLIKILTGVVTMDSGEIFLNEKKVKIHSPSDANNKGISSVYQELDLIPQLSIAENIFLGREKTKKGLIHWNNTYDGADKILKSMGLTLDVRAPLSSQSTAIQQMVSIARAISINSKLVVLDEPTSSLDNSEVTILFKVIRDLKQRDISVIFITHRLDEVFEISDEITILKDGECVATSLVKDITKLEMVSKMVGSDATNIVDYKKTYNMNKVSSHVILEGQNLNRKPKVVNQSIQLKKGEILGLAGLLGSGRTELIRLLFGADMISSGQIQINGTDVNLKSTRDAIDHHIGYCSEDRKTEGIIPYMSVKDNLTLSIINNISKYGIISKEKQSEIVNQYIKSLQIKISNPNQPIRSLSGGNQQKVLLARWLCANPEVLILDEPTRGIDVGAKKEILDFVENLAKKGISILIVASELEELVQSCDRIQVIRDGRTVGFLDTNDISIDSIMNTIAHGSTKEAQK